MYGYMISYDLRKPQRDYTKLYEGIKAFGTYASVLESVWLVKTNWTASQVCDYLKQFIDGDDKLFVMAVTPRVWASVNLPTTTVNWLHQQMAA